MKKKSSKFDGKCPDCGKDAAHRPFRNDGKSIDEYLKTGRCQDCIDGKTKKVIVC